MSEDVIGRPLKNGDEVYYNGQKWKIIRWYSDKEHKIKNLKDGNEIYASESNMERVVPKVKSAVGTFGKVVLGVKLKMPAGVKLNDNEAKYIIDGWEDQKSVVRKKQTDLASVSDKIERHIAKTNSEVPEAMKLVKDAKRYFEQSKDPLMKRKWARKVVIRTAYYEQVRNSQHALVATVDRVKDAVDDAQYVYKTLESRIAEAKIYRELNGGLHLVGKSLLEARTKHMLPEVEYQNLEVTMESIEKSVSQKDDDQLLIEAQAIVSDPTRWSENEGKASTNKKATSKGK